MLKSALQLPPRSLEKVALVCAWTGKTLRGKKVGMAQRSPLMAIVCAAATGITLLLLAGCGGISEAEGDRIVQEGYAEKAQEAQLYCVYGGQTEGQIRACTKSFDTSEIIGKHTEAAEYAKGSKIECGKEAGPFCSERTKMKIEAHIARVLAEQLGE